MKGNEMVQQPRQGKCPRLLVLLTSLVLLGASGLPTRAADPNKSRTSLQLVPADAAFYSAMLRNREQIEALTKSRAWATLRALPVVKQGLEQVEAQLQSPQAAPFRQMLEQPENKELLSLLQEAGAEEVFVYGSDSWGDFVELALALNGAQQLGPLSLVLSGKANITQINELRGKALLHALAESTDLIKVPDVVIGFKLSDSKKADSQLKRLETLAKGLVEQVPPLKGRFKRTKVADGSFLTLTLDGSLVPWDKIPFKDLEDKEGEFDKLIKKLHDLKLSLSLGVSGKYLLVSLGGSTEALAKLAAKGPKLGDRPELKPLARFSDRKITSIGYASKDLRTRATTNHKDMDGMVEMVKGWLDNAGLDEKQKKKMLRDLGEIANDLKKAIPVLGAGVAVSFLTETGQETFGFDYSKVTVPVKPQPLTLLDHLGGSPVLAGLGRSASSTSDYDTLVKWVKLVHDNADNIVLSRLDGDARDKYQAANKALLPLFQRLDTITGKQFLPSLADGQFGLVIDAKWTSKRWLMLAPPTEQALPMLELAVVLGVSDAALLQKAMGEYRRLVDDAIGVIRELVPDANIPEIKVPAPKSVKKQTGTLYYYEVPAGLTDARLVPTAGVGDKVAVLALSHQHAERLLARKPLQIKDLPTDDLKRPLVSVAVFNWPGLVDAATPWIELAADTAIKQHLGEDAPRKTVADIKTQVHTVLEVLKCFKGAVSTTSLEEGVVVTHSVSTVRDLEK